MAAVQSCCIFPLAVHGVASCGTQTLMWSRCKQYCYMSLLGTRIMHFIVPPPPPHPPTSATHAPSHAPTHPRTHSPTHTHTHTHARTHAHIPSSTTEKNLKTFGSVSTQIIQRARQFAHWRSICVCIVASAGGICLEGKNADCKSHSQQTTTKPGQHQAAATIRPQCPLFLAYLGRVM